eukprot:572788-Rhodomonas_salina.1
MKIQWFMKAAMALLFEDEEFHQLVNHPTLDVLTSAPFKKAVVTFVHGHGFAFATNTPAAPATYDSNYEIVLDTLSSIQSQLSDACAATMEQSFTEEMLIDHPLKALRIWRRMADSFDKISPEDSGSCMTALQNHASFIGDWDLDALQIWIKQTEFLRQELLRTGESNSIANNCIVEHLLEALTSVPSSAPHSKAWEFDARTWNAQHVTHKNMMWQGGPDSGSQESK